MKKRIIKSLTFVAFLLVSVPILHAIPADPNPVAFTQPNGKTLTVMIKGDEWVNWYQSIDGYTLLFNNAGYLSYAQLDEYGNLLPSDYLATEIEERDIVINSFLNTIEKKLFYSDVQMQLKLKLREIEDELSSQNFRGENISGHYKILCALVQFPEKSMIKTKELFDPLFNELGYTGNNVGSVRDYYKEVSYSNLDITVTLCGIYTAPQSETSYAGTGGHDNAQALAYWAATQVKNEPHINFKDFDSNNNGKVDCFHFIFAGLGREAGGGKETIWSHKSNLPPGFTVIKDGVYIDKYSCSPELRSGTSITTVGVICHEMCHVFGASDFYDTDYEINGEFVGTGNWDLMASGSWNGSGNRPAHPNMYIKVKFGWVVPTVLSSARKVVDMPNSAENPVAYRINTTTSGEHYLLENRQRINFDAAVPANGLLIYHVHSAPGTYCINCKHPQRMYPVCAGRYVQMPGPEPYTYGNINSIGCVFPGSSNKTDFTDDTTPAMRSWANKPTNKPITNITHIDRLISFDFMKGMGVGIDDTEQTPHTSLTIIPNPANDYIDIQFANSNAFSESVVFYNLTGQIVKSVPFHCDFKEDIITQRISISDLGKGFYFIKVGNETAKLVVQ